MSAVLPHRVGQLLWWLGLAIALISTAFLLQCVYHIFFHPLRKIPGPWWAAASRLPMIRALSRGDQATFLEGLHRKYGPVVRFTPNEVSFTNGDKVWPEIYGFRTGKQKGTESFQKDKTWYSPGIDGHPSILNALDEPHNRLRRSFSHPFSERSLRSQEPLIMVHIDRLVSQLISMHAATSTTADLALWYMWTTSDVISDLTFGETFGSLSQAKSHQFVQLMKGAISAFPTRYSLSYFPALNWLRALIFDERLINAFKDLELYVKETTLDRIKRQDTSRPDFMTDIIKNRTSVPDGGKKSASDGEIVSTTNVLVVAGTDTTSSVLSAATYYVLSNKHIHETVRREIRDSFQSDDEIRLDRVSNLKYMDAILTEALRMMPAVPAGFPRSVPKSGAMIDGYWLDGTCNASVSVSQFPAYHDERNFRDADQFVPERWLDNSDRYQHDVKSAFQPFSFGPRNCLGKNLAHAEMRLIFAKMMFNFDMRLDEASIDWPAKSRVFGGLWTVAKLQVHLTPAKRS